MGTFPIGIGLKEALYYTLFQIIVSNFVKSFAIPANNFKNRIVLLSKEKVIFRERKKIKCQSKNKTSKGEHIRLAMANEMLIKLISN